MNLVPKRCDLIAVHVQVHRDTGPPPEAPGIRALANLLHQDAQLAQGGPAVRHHDFALSPQRLVHGGKVEGATSFQRSLDGLQEGGEAGELVAEVADAGLGCAQGLVEAAEGGRDLTSQAKVGDKAGVGNGAAAYHSRSVDQGHGGRRDG